MARIVLIPCGGIKAAYPTVAACMYQGRLFKLILRYAKRLKPNKIFILSAKYGLLSLNLIIKPYQKTLSLNLIKKL